MSCFLVPLTQALVTSAYRKNNATAIHSDKASALKRNVPALEKMLWGGSVMLIVDHIINGELTWRFPFFTALNDGWSIFLHEILAVGVPMSLALTAVWAIYAVLKEKRKKTTSISI